MPIRLGDLQGPLDNAALIFGHTAFLEAADHGAARGPPAPRARHRPHDRIRPGPARIVRAAGRGVRPERFPALDPRRPGPLGRQRRRRDALARAPRRVRRALLNRLSEAFGGVYIHSCGDWTHLFPSLEKVRGLRGLEFGASETPYDKVPGAFRRQDGPGLPRRAPPRHQGSPAWPTSSKRIVAAAPTPRGLFIHVDITNGLVGPDGRRPTSRRSTGSSIGGTRPGAKASGEDGTPASERSDGIRATSTAFEALPRGHGLEARRPTPGPGDMVLFVLDLRTPEGRNARIVAQRDHRRHLEDLGPPARRRGATAEPDGRPSRAKGPVRLTAARRRTAASPSSGPGLGLDVRLDPFDLRFVDRARPSRPRRESRGRRRPWPAGRSAVRAS